MELKYCKFCEKEKNIILFTKDKKVKTGYGSKCSDCARKQSFEYRKTLEYKLKSKEYRKKNKQKSKEYQLLYSIKNSDKNKKRAVLWVENNRQKFNESSLKRNLIKIKNLDDLYLKNLLRQQGFKTNQITLELIELKRITLKTTRLCRQLKN